MATTKKPGENTDNDGGIFQEVGPRGGPRENFTTVKDNTTLPPTTEPGNTWKQIERTPDSTRKPTKK